MGMPNTVKRNIEEVQKEILKKRKKMDTLYKEIAELDFELLTLCDHKDTTPYLWEHDNGFGRQSKMKGKECKYCHKIDMWNNDNFIHKNQRQDPDYGGGQ